MLLIVLLQLPSAFQDFSAPLRRIGKGKKNREIALDLHLTEGTVKNYVTNSLTCLNLRDRLQVDLWVAHNLTEAIDS